MTTLLGFIGSMALIFVLGPLIPNPTLPPVLAVGLLLAAVLKNRE